MTDKVILLGTYLLCFSNLASSGHCHSMADTKKLFADRMIGYEKQFRPLLNQSKSLNLNIGLELLSIQDFDEVREKLTISAFVLTYWIDEYMKWDRKDFGGLDELVIENDNVWTPNLVLINNVNKLEKIGDAWQPIRFLPSGLAAYFPGNIFSASCLVDVTYYPFDRHKCSFIFSTWAQASNEISLTPYSDSVQTSYFSENGAWALYNKNIYTDPGTNTIHFILYLERKPQFVLVNVILPIVFMSFLNTIIFAIPAESGERISYSITVLLAIAVFITLLGDNLPKTSSPMSLFGYYLMAILIVSISITLATILNMRLYYKDEDDPVPDWIADIVRRLQCKCKNTRTKGRSSKMKYNKERRNANNGRQIQNMQMITDSYMDKRMPDVYQVPSKGALYQVRGEGMVDQNNSISKTNDRGGVKTTKQEDVISNRTVSWKVVSFVLDKLFFTISFVIISIATITFFAYVTGSRHI